MLNFDVHQTMPTLLLVDDDLVSREVAATVLTMRGYSVETADRGETALAMLVERKIVPDAILLDVQLPGLLSGVELISALRVAHPATILLISASEPPADLRAAADGFLSKPFDAATLARLLTQAKHPKRDHIRTATLLPAVNDETLAQLRDLMPADAVREIFSTVVADLHQRIAALDEAIAREDHAAIARIGHAIKGGCGMAGASEAAAIGAQFESFVTTRAGGNHLDNETALLRDLRTATTRLERMLKTDFLV